MPSIGFIGLGMMGGAMVRRLLSHEFSVTVWNRTAEKAVPLEEAGASVARTIEDLAASESVVLSMLSDSEALSVVAAEVRRTSARGSVHIDMSTVSPATTRACEQRAREAGTTFIHAPVLGSVPQVNDGKLLIFAGGERTAIDTAAPVFSALGNRVFPFDSAPEATHLKLCCNFFIASMIATLGQGFRFAEEAGLKREVLLDVLSASALAAPMYASKGANIIAGNFTPRFFLDHMLKDVRLFREAARELQCELPFPGILEDAFARASEAGFGSDDYSSVVKVL